MLLRLANGLRTDDQSLEEPQQLHVLIRQRGASRVPTGVVRGDGEVPSHKRDDREEDRHRRRDRKAGAWPAAEGS